MTRNLAFALAATALLSGCSSMSDVDGLFGYAPPQPNAGAATSQVSGLSAAPATAVLPLPPAPTGSSYRSARAPGAAPLPAAAPEPMVASAPLAFPAPEARVEASALPALAPASTVAAAPVAAAPAVALAATPLPDAVAARPSTVPSVAAEIPDEAATSRLAELPAADAASATDQAPANPSIASNPEDGERDRMVASALEPASDRQTLGELKVSSNGTMILPKPRQLDIIDIAPIRDSLQDATAPGE